MISGRFVLCIVNLIDDFCCIRCWIATCRVRSHRCTGAFGAICDTYGALKGPRVEYKSKIRNLLLYDDVSGSVALVDVNLSMATTAWRTHFRL